MVIDKDTYRRFRRILLSSTTRTRKRRPGAREPTEDLSKLPPEPIEMAGTGASGSVASDVSSVRASSHLVGRGLAVEERGVIRGLRGVILRVLASSELRLKMLPPDTDLSIGSSIILIGEGVRVPILRA